MTAHEVFNQVPPRSGVNEYSRNTALVEAVARWGAGAPGLHRDAEHLRRAAGLEEIGALVGTARFQHDAELANTSTPVLHTHDRYGNRLDEVEYHPSYHRIIEAAVKAGAHTSAWAHPGAGASVDRAAAFYLFAQVEPGHACPISMTHAGVAIVKNTDLPNRDDWMRRLLSTVYRPWSPSSLRDGPPAGAAEPGALMGMAMTEKQGGSDVRANTTRAVPNGDGSYSITGHKWFCSAPMSDAFFVLAQTDKGLGCFFVPRSLPDGSDNVFRIQRLKDKLGNKSNASSELEFEGTIGWLAGEEGRGVKTILPMVGRTRLDCVIGTAAGMRQSVVEAVHHAGHREAFGRTLRDQPAMAAVLADLQLESEAATITALRLARAHDEDADEQEQAFRRLATAVAKYWVCKRGPGHAYEALECLGGNGYTEAFPLARRYREQPVMAVWEGSGNVIALDVLRALTREPDSVRAFFDELDESKGADASLDAYIERAQALAHELATASPDLAARRARELVERLALALEASLVIRYSPSAVADAFLASRIREQHGLYGVLPGRADLEAILARV